MLIKKRREELLSSDATPEPLSRSIAPLPPPRKKKEKKVVIAAEPRSVTDSQVSSESVAVSAALATKQTNQRKRRTSSVLRCEKRERWQKRKCNTNPTLFFYEPFNYIVATNPIEDAVNDRQ